MPLVSDADGDGRHGKSVPARGMRQAEADPCSAGGVFQPDASTVGFDDGTRYGQAQPRAVRALGGESRAAEESLEDLVAVVSGDPLAGVGDFDEHGVIGIRR